MNRDKTKQPSERTGRRTHITDLQALAVKLLSAVDPELLLQEILVQASLVMGAAHASIAVLNENDDSTMCVRFGVGIHAARIGFEVKTTEGAIGEVCRTGEVYVIDDYRIWKNRINDSRMDQMTTSVSAPLLASGKIMGVLQLSWQNEPIIFSEDNRTILRQYSQLASIALEKALLFQQLRREKSLLEAIFNCIPGMIYLYDEQGLLLRWNKMLEITTGYSPTELSSMHLFDWFHHSQTDTDNITRGLQKAKEEGFGDAEVTIIRKDGSMKQLYLTAVPMLLDDKPHIAGIGLDISEKKQATLALEQVEARFRSLVDAAPLGIHIYHLEEDDALILTHANPHADKLTTYKHELLIGKPIEEVSPPLADTFIPELYRRIARGEHPAHSFETSPEHALDNQTYWVNAFRIDKNSVAVTFLNITVRKEMEEELRRHRDRLEVLVGERTGDLMAANQELAAMNEEMTAMNETLENANVRLEEEIAVRMQKEEDLSRRERQYRATTRLLTNTSHNLDTYFDSFLRDALQLVKAPTGYIALFDAKRKLLVIEHALGPVDVFIKEPRAVDSTLQGQVFKNGKAVYVEDYRQFPQRFIDPRLSRFTSFIAVPLRQGGQIRGVLSVAWLDEVHPLSEEDQEVLQQYADLASVALERASANARITRQNQLLHDLADMAKALLGQLTLEKVLQDILDKVILLADMPHGFICLFDGGNNIVKAGRGRFADMTGSLIKIKDSVFENAARADETLVITDAASSLFENDGVLLTDITTVVETPLKRDGKIIGLIALAAFGESIELDEEKLATVNQLATVASIAVKNALHHEETHTLAFQDTLTGLPNRAFLKKQLIAEMELARQGNSCGALFFIDLDDLKTINDTLGHSIGDEVIITASRHILSVMGDQAFVARIGGDEFVALLPSDNARTSIALLAETVVQKLSQEYHLSGQHIHMSASIGITLYPEDCDTAEDALKNADSAMYAAKDAGRNCWRFYDPALQEEAYEKILLTNNLRRAQENGELMLHYQPIIDAHSSVVKGFEALLRWNSPIHGSVSPARFIPFAEQSGVILPIGRWVLAETCRFARNLTIMGFSHLHIAVNISPRQLSAPDFVDMVRTTIAESGVNPRQLEIEVTEHMLIESMDESIAKLFELRDLGLNISLDDFGTGYSSLTYLRRLPVNTLKIDKSFIDTIVMDETQAHLIRFIIDMAQSLGLTVVAEGVETKEQLEKLAQLNCDSIQGYVFSGPATEMDVLLLL